MVALIFCKSGPYIVYEIGGWTELKSSFLQWMAVDNTDLECYLLISADYAAQYIIIQFGSK